MAFRDIRKSRKFLTATDVGFILGVLVLIVALLALNIYIARTFQGGEWLLMRWSGARAFLAQSGEPYGSALAQSVQRLVYGRAAYLNEYPYVLNDPFYIVLFYTPLAFISNFVLVRAIWMLFSQAALVGIVLLTLRLAEWQAPTWMFILLMGVGIFNYFSLHALLSASPAIFLTLIYLGVLSALRSFSDELAGMLLAFIAYQWEVGLLFFLVIFILAIANRRWQMLAGLGMTVVVLLMISFLTNSGWAIPYARAVLFDWTRGLDYTFSTTLSYLFPQFNSSYGTWIVLALAVILLIEIVLAVRAEFLQISWLAFLALTMTPWLGFAIFPTNHIALVPAFLLVIALAWERWQKQRGLVMTLLISAILFLPYGLFYLSLNSPTRLYVDLMRILPPIAALLSLYWMRWWAVRPPRIWADQLGTRK